MLEVRRESREDFVIIKKLTEAAFAKSPYGHQGESDLIDLLRRSSPNFLSLVAVQDDEVVGHAIFSEACIKTTYDKISGMGLGPMAVAPAYQRHGIGTRLVMQGVEQVFERGYQFVMVAGDPNYYLRFGFRPASEWGVTHGFDGMPQEVFFLLWNPDRRSSISEGQAFYDPSFGPQHILD
jgi:putative acetyltransferase